MEEILSAVADEVTATGTPTICHRGFISDVVEPGRAFVVVPHEYFALAPEESSDLYARTIGFGVEHPGTTTFTAAIEASTRLGARFEISLEAVEAFHGAGLAADHFAFGYVEGWDRWRQADLERVVDLVYLGTADERRIGLIAGMADDLEGLSCELLIPPHEPMTRERPDFLLAEKKWDLLARSKVLVNLHREEKLGFERVRCLEAVVNGCVVVTEPCTEFGPFVPGEHLLVAEPERIGAVARAIVADELLRRQIAANAYGLCVNEMRMAESARRVAAVATTLPVYDSVPEPPFFRSQPLVSDGKESPLAVWIPEVGGLPSGAAKANEPWLVEEHAELARLRSTRANVSSIRALPGAPRPEVDVICVRRPGDGPLGVTIDSLREDRDIAALHVASSPCWWNDGPPGPKGGISTYATADLMLGRGRARNLLLERSDAEFVCVVDSGDLIRPGALRRLMKLIRSDAGLDVVFAMATHGQNRMANVLIPELRRLADRNYLSRGFVVRRRLLERIQGFSEEPLFEGFVDHIFWQDSLQIKASIRLARWIGFALWPQRPSHLPAQLDPYRVRQAMSAEVTGDDFISTSSSSIESVEPNQRLAGTKCLPPRC